MGLTHFLQVLVSRKDNSLICRQRLRPSRLACHGANASCKRRIIQGSTSRLETRKLFEFQGGARHHEAVTIICVLLRRLRFSQRSVSLVILEHSLISEGECVAIKTELRYGAVGARERDSGKSTEPPNPHRFAHGPEHHIKREPGW